MEASHTLPCLEILPSIFRTNTLHSTPAIQNRFKKALKQKRGIDAEVREERVIEEDTLRRPTGNLNLDSPSALLYSDGTMECDAVAQ